MNRIITKIVGGLGNQMFQYAIGRAAAEKSGLPLLLDISDFKTYRRPYFLDRFNVKEDYLPDSEAAEYRKFEKRRSPRLFWENLKPIKDRAYRLEKSTEYFKFIPDFLVPAEGRDTYLNGYWQNESYFKDIRQDILKELSLKSELSIDSTEIAGRARLSESVGIHFRRGEDQLTKSLYGVPPLDYYHSALDFIKTKTGKPLHAIIFTNDPEWVKENFKPDCPHEFAVDSKLEDYQELVLMARCKHQIIANSTFSWWGAWLNDNPDRIVCAPKKWFNLEGKFDTSGLIPPDWVKL